MITVQLATIPERIAILPEVIDSLYLQVDRVNVICNGHTKEQITALSTIYKDMDVYFYKRENQMTDGEKYYRIEEAEPGYIFTCDDDLLYGPGYVDYMISKIEQYGRKAVISLHGRCWEDFPIWSFYRDRADVNPFDGTRMPHDGDKPVIYRCMADVIGDHRVHCCGDGVAAWHTDTLRMKYEYVELPNMAQLWLCLTCNRFDVPQIVVEHKEGIVENLWDGEGIWDRQKDDSIQTGLINQRWIER